MHISTVQETNLITAVDTVSNLRVSIDFAILLSVHICAAWLTGGGFSHSHMTHAQCQRILFSVSVAVLIKINDHGT